MTETNTTIAKQDAIAAITSWFDDIWSRGDMQAVDDVLDANLDFILTFNQTHGLDQFKRLLTINRTAFENLVYRGDEIVVDGNTGAAYWTMYTTKHRAPWNNVEPSGKEASIHGMSIFHFANGKIVEIKVISDLYGLMRQIGGIK
jgi:predicted ester cyclase